MARRREHDPGMENERLWQLMSERGCHYDRGDSTMSRLVRDIRRQERNDLRNRILSIHMDAQARTDYVNCTLIAR